MTLNTPSIKELIDTRDAIIKTQNQRIRERINAGQKQLRTSAKKLTTLNEITYLETLKDPTDQIEAYGRKKWDDIFIKAKDIALQSVSLDDLKPKDIEHVMEQLENSRLAWVQWIFSHLDHHVVLRMKQSGMNKFPLNGILVGPDLFPDKMLVDVGFVAQSEFEALRGEPIARIALKKTKIDAVKMFCQSLIPIIPNQRRLMRIPRPTDDDRADYPADTPIVSDDAVGGIVYIREEPRGEDEPRKLQMQIFGDGMYSARRKTSHVDGGYAKEIDRLVDCQHELEQIRRKLNWQYRKETPDAEKEKLWAEAVDILARSEEMLSACTNGHKVEAQKFLATAKELRTKKDKPLVSGVMSKITAALTRIDRRFNEIQAKGGCNSQDNIILHRQIRNGETTMMDTRDDVRYAALNVEGSATSTDDIRENLRHGIAKNLAFAVSSLEKILLKPLAAPAEAMIRQIQALTPNDSQEFENQLLTLHAIGKIQGLISSLERIRGRTAKNGYVDFAYEAVFLTKVEAAFRGEQIFPGKSVEKLEDIMETLGERLSDLRAFMERHATTPPAEEEVEEIQKILETRMDAFDTKYALGTITLGLKEAIPYEPAFTLTN